MLCYTTGSKPYLTSYGQPLARVFPEHYGTLEKFGFKQKPCVETGAGWTREVMLLDMKFLMVGNNC